MIGGVRLSGQLDSVALERTINEIVRRHETLRTAFVNTDGRPLQVVAASRPLTVELLDLRTLVPWDRAAVLESVARTHRCLIVHEDNMTAGFGAEIAAVLAQEAFGGLDAPVERVAMPDIPVPHCPSLLDSVLPDTDTIVAAIRRLASY